MGSVKKSTRNAIFKWYEMIPSISMAHESTHRLSARSFSPTLWPGTPLPTRSNPRANRASAPGQLESLERDLRAVAAHRSFGSHRARREQPKAPLSFATHLLGFSESGLESGQFLPRDRPQGAGVVCAAGRGAARQPHGREKGSVLTIDNRRRACLSHGKLNFQRNRHATSLAHRISRSHLSSDEPG